eukprot:446671_1
MATINPRDEPIASHIDAKDWKIQDIRNKNKIALQTMMTENNISYEATFTNAVLENLLIDLKRRRQKEANNAKNRANAVARASQQKEENKQKRKQKVIRMWWCKSNKSYGPNRETG